MERSDASTRRDPAIRITLLPRDTNPYGTIFGGIILSLIDQAGAVATRRVTRRSVVTVSMHEVVFKRPVYVGDLISVYAEVTRVGTTSITTHVSVEAERRRNPDGVVSVTEAEVGFVDVGPQPAGDALRGAGLDQRGDHQQAVLSVERGDARPHGGVDRGVQ